MLLVAHNLQAQQQYHDALASYRLLKQNIYNSFHTTSVVTQVIGYSCDSARLKKPTKSIVGQTKSFPGGVDYPTCRVSIVLTVLIV